jgi:TolA-binding protein
MRIWILTIIVWIMLVAPSGADGGFTQVDRERMIRLEVKFEEMDKRFEQVDKRLVELREDMNKRFEQVDKRLVELREDMNNRFVQVDKRFEQVDKRFEQVDKRFEQVDKRFEQIMSMFYILSGIFTAMFTAVFGFAWWDRRSILVQAREEARNILKPHEDRSQGVEEKLNNIMELLRRWSAKKPELKELMRYCNLL